MSNEWLKLNADVVVWKSRKKPEDPPEIDKEVHVALIARSTVNDKADQATRLIAEFLRIELDGVTAGKEKQVVGDAIAAIKEGRVVLLMKEPEVVTPPPA